MVLFGAPVSMSSAEQASECYPVAQAMRAGMAGECKVAKQSIAEVSMRIGIHREKLWVISAATARRLYGGRTKRKPLENRVRLRTGEICLA